MTTSKTIDPPNRWSPQTPEDRQLVLDELKAILSSHHFSSSKRYPALLEHVVNKALDGHLDQLKERTLGVEVFDRVPNYDTNADPVVRFAAGEVRKRIAQFYHEHGKNSGIQIGLPPGSYVPEFKLVSTSSKPQEDRDRTSAVGLREAAGPYRSPLTANLASLAALWARGKLRPAAFKPHIVSVVALLIGLVPVIAFALHRGQQPKIVDEMWGPLFKSPGSVQIVIGNGIHENGSPADPQRETLVNQLHGAYDRLSVCDVVAVSRLAAMLGNQSRSYEIKEANFTSLQDLRNRSVILIGAYNNLWTLRLMEPLRFHFLKDGHSVRIVDAKNPQSGGWSVDYSNDSPSTVNDYAIVARYSDPTTNSSVLIIAGIGAYGTQAASEAVATPHDLEKLLASMPKDWPKKNLEVIVKTTIINGEASPAQAVSATTW